MTILDTLPTNPNATLIRPDFERNDKKQPLVSHPKHGGMTRYYRPSSYGKTIEDDYNLNRWQLRNVVLGMAESHALVARALAADPNEDNYRDEINTIAADAQAVVKAHDRADIGTALHLMIKRASLGQVLTLPEPFAADLVAYFGCLEAHGLEVADGMVEMSCVQDDMKMAGTFDVVVRERSSGELFVGDLKTGDTLAYSHIGYGVQLWIYAHSVLYDTALNQRIETPRLNQQRALIFHLPAASGHCELNVVDLGAAGEAVELVNQVRKMRYRNILSPVPAPMPAPIVSAVPDSVWNGSVGGSASPSALPAPPVTDELTEPASETTATVATDQPGLAPDPAPVDHRLEALVARYEAIKAEGEPALRYLASLWPVGVPTFKQARTQTDTELSAIDAVLANVERKYLEPFPAAEHPVDIWTAPKSEPAAPLPTEGDAADPEMVAAQRERYVKLSGEALAVVNGWAQQARLAGGDLSVTRNPSKRRVELARALQTFIDAGVKTVDDEVVRAAVAKTIGEPVKRGTSTGAYLARMGVDQATVLADIAYKIVAGAVVVYVADDGTVTLREVPEGTL